MVTVDAYLRSFVKQCVAFLYNEEVNRKGDLVKRPIGTCFFAGHATPDRKSIYLVTAKHVYKDLLAGDGGIYARVNVAAGGVHYFRLPRDGWTEHPNKEVDLAVLPWFPHIEKSQLLEGSEVDPDPQFITQGLPTTMLQGRPLPKSVEGTIFTLPLAVILLAPKYAAEWEKAWPPEEGEQVFFVGLMLQHQGTERNYPAFRMGHIALNTDEEIDLITGRAQYRMIEAQCYRGNSGAPTWVYYDEPGQRARWAFLGVLTTGFRSEPDQFGGKDIFNYGISAVVPGEYLAEVLIDLEANKDKRPSEVDRGTPMSASGERPFMKADMEVGSKAVSRRKPSRPAKASRRTSE